jgi:hypothetical protein
LLRLGVYEREETMENILFDLRGHEK